MKRIQLSKNFFLDEFTRSETAARHGLVISVMDQGRVFNNLKRLCVGLLQPLRDEVGPLHVLSGYRPRKVNRLVGGSRTSAHVHGLAADVISSTLSSLDLATAVAQFPYRYDQVIHEFGQWVHIAAPVDDTPLYEALTAVKVPRLVGRPKTVYVSGVLPIRDAIRQAVPRLR